MRGETRAVFSRVAALALASFLALAAHASAATPKIGEPAPAFTLTTIDGRTVRLAEYRGRTLVVNVWGSWCPPCRLETPDLVAEAGAMRASGVAFLGIDTTETRAIVRAFAAAKNVPYPQVATTDRSAFARDYAITNFPTTYVIDPAGILRAAHADNILPRAQLHAYVVAARRGTSAPLVSDEQRKLDASLAPDRFSFEGDRASVLANVRDAATAIASAESEMDDAMDDPARDHDLLATHAEENALRTRAIAALMGLAQAPEDPVMLPRLKGDAAVAGGDYAAAVSEYRSALAMDASDGAALDGLAYALSKAGDEAGVVETDRRIVAVAPTYAHEIALARALASTGDRAGTLAAIDAAIPLAAAQSAAALAWTHLYAGAAAIKISDRDRARTEFVAAGETAVRVPRSDPRYAWYLERSQEALLALGLDAGSTATAVTIAPWTGPDLPGSLASTYKYRVAISGAAGRAVQLHASGLPRHWIASFCSDRLCSPFTYRATLPKSGVKLIEFQVIPEGAITPAHVRPVVRIDAISGSDRRSVRTTIATAT